MIFPGRPGRAANRRSAGSGERVIMLLAGDVALAEHPKAYTMCITVTTVTAGGGGQRDDVVLDRRAPLWSRARGCGSAWSSSAAPSSAPSADHKTYTVCVPGRGARSRSGGRKGRTMQFHHHGYVSTEPRVAPAAGTGLDRPEELPETMDVLIVGSGPAGVIAAAQLAQYPEVSTRIIERRPGRRRRRAAHRRGLPDHRDELLGPGPGEPAAHHPHLPHRRRHPRGQRVPPPDRQPGPRAGLLSRGRPARPGPHRARLRLGVHR